MDDLVIMTQLTQRNNSKEQVIYSVDNSTCTWSLKARCYTRGGNIWTNSHFNVEQL